MTTPRCPLSSAARIDAEMKDFLIVGLLLERLQQQQQQLDSLQQQALWSIVKIAAERKRVLKSFADRFT